MARESNKKRELIFIALAVIGLLYGAVDYVMRSTKIKSTSSGGDRVLAEATFSLVSEELSAGAARQQEGTALDIVNALSAQWPDNKFAVVAVDDEEAKEEEALVMEEKVLVYSGYMNMGEKIFAVINGIEYRIGDLVEGFILKEIDPMEIIMEKNGRPTHVPFRRIE